MNPPLVQIAAQHELQQHGPVGPAVRRHEVHTEEWQRQVWLLQQKIVRVLVRVRECARACDLNEVLGPMSKAKPMRTKTHEAWHGVDRKVRH